MADTAGEFRKDIIAGAVSETASKVLESDIAKSLLGLAASEIGQLLGDVNGAIRFHANDILSRMCSSRRSRFRLAG
jgi:hypothetical protein